jgi:hypothetical protein
MLKGGGGPKKYNLHLKTVNAVLAASCYILRTSSQEKRSLFRRYPPASPKLSNLHFDRTFWDIGYTSHKNIILKVFTAMYMQQCVAQVEDITT